jgi:hypothetical protein
MLGGGGGSGYNWFISEIFGFRKLEELLAERRNCRTKRNATSCGARIVVLWDLKTRDQLQV